MKKKMKKLLASLLASVMMFSTLSLTAAAEGEEFDMFLAIGAQTDGGDWDLQYYGEGAESNVGDIVATNAKAKVGDTVTLSLTMPAEVGYTWFVAPVLVAEGVGSLDYTLDSIKLDGEDVLGSVDLSAGDAWWYEGTGSYTEEQAIRLAGGFNEWSTKYMAESPAGFTTIEYTITINGIGFGAGDGYEMFVAIGAQTDGGDWDLQYYGEGAEGNVGDIVATNAVAKAGDTVTIGLTMPAEVGYTWFAAPVMIAEGVGNVDYTIDSIKLDGDDILSSVDLSAGDAWWYEGTGSYTEEQAIRLAGGYNEWGTKYIAEAPAGFTTIEYTITINGVEFGAPAGELIPSTESYEAFIAFGGDRESEEDWRLGYEGDSSKENAAGITATHGTVKAGETTTISLEFENPVLNVWYVAPCLIFPNGDAAQISDQSDFDIKVYLDGEEVDVDFSAGAICWAEGTGDYTGDQAVRLAGGYNEWGAKYIAEPSGFTNITFEITANSILLAPIEEAPQYDFDPNGTYHAYLGVQTPTWIFRNGYNDASYGRDVDGGAYFGELGFIDGGWIAQGGTFTDVEITGNGTYTVSLTGYDFSGEFNGESILGAEPMFNLLFVSTDLPRNEAVVISNVVLKMDGKEITTQAEPFLDPDQKETQSILLANNWNNEVSALPYFAAPTNSIEISFTVSGFAKDAEVQATEAPAATEAPEAPAEGGSNTTMIIIIVVVVVVVAAVVCGVVVSKKKK